jgi:hypothetical protein
VAFELYMSADIKTDDEFRFFPEHLKHFDSKSPADPVKLKHVPPSDNREEWKLE